MKVLVVGGTGATGRCFVNQLLSHDSKVAIVVRKTDMIDTYFKDKNNLTVIPGNVLEMDNIKLFELVKDVDAIGSCLGHNLTFKGVFGKPRKLVTETVQRLCIALQKHDQYKPVKFVLMNTTANKNKDTREKLSPCEEIVMSLIRTILPPQSDNEHAAEYLRSCIGKNNKKIEWVVVRPDTLVNEDNKSEYKVYDSPIRSPIFDAGTTSRINVGNFMAELIVNETKWNEWKGKMPVIYNASSMKGM